MHLSRRHCITALACTPGLAIGRSPARARPPYSRTAALGLYTAATAPDQASRLALARPLGRLTDGFTRGASIPAFVHGRFAQGIEHNFALSKPASVARWLDNANATTLQALAQAYVNATELEGRPMQALDILAHRLDPARLARLAGVFGHARMHAAVWRAAPSKIDAFNGLASVAHQGPLPGVWSLGPVQPGAARTQSQNYLTLLDYTIPEIYLHFRTAPIGATSIAASAFQTSLVVGSGVSFAWGAGYTIGTGIVTTLQYFAPGVWDSIVDLIGAWIEALREPPTLPPDYFQSPEELNGTLQMIGFRDVFDVEPPLWDSFALGGGDNGSTAEWAGHVDYTSYGDAPPEPIPDFPPEIPSCWRPGACGGDIPRGAAPASSRTRRPR